MSAADSRFISCPACHRRLGDLLRRQRVLVVTCPRCGARVCIHIDCSLATAGDTSIQTSASAPVRRRKARKSANPKSPKGGADS